MEIAMKMATPRPIPSRVLNVLEALDGEAVGVVVVMVLVVCADTRGGVEEVE